MNFRNRLTTPDHHLTPAELEQARAQINASICTGWDQDSYEAYCAEEEAMDAALAALKGEQA